MPKVATVPIPAFTEDDVMRWFGAHEIVKAQPYVQRISSVRAEGNLLFAQVPGSAAKPYGVIVHFQTDARGRVAPRSVCSCPVGQQCKHAAAMLLAWLTAQTCPTRVNPAVLGWVEGLRQARSDVTVPAVPASAREHLYYSLHLAADDDTTRVEFFKVRGDTLAGAKRTQWNGVERALSLPPAFIDDDDLTLLPLLWSLRDSAGWGDRYLLTGSRGELALERMLATGRLVLADAPTQVLQRGPVRTATLAWRVIESRVRARIDLDPPVSATRVLDHAWYFDGSRGEVGVLDTGLPAGQLAALLALPPLAAPDLPVVASALAEFAPSLPRPEAADLRVIDAVARPRLSLQTLAVARLGRYRGYATSWTRSEFDCARFGFVYDGFEVDAAGSSEYLAAPDGTPVRIRRDAEREAACRALLAQWGMTAVPDDVVARSEPLWALEREADWVDFMHDAVPALRAQGWEIVVPPGFRHLLLEVEVWEADFEATDDGGLAVDLGVVIEGQRLALAPLLYELFQRDGRWLDAIRLARIRDAERVVLFTPEGSRVHVPAARIKPLARTLIDLFDTRPDGALRVSALDAPRFAGLADDAGWQQHGQALVHDWTARLAQLQQVTPVEPPAGFQLELRGYQREGLAWLQHLRAHQLAGILADDMGLGKTAQTLAHLLLEKHAGRLDQPALVVLPTSLVFNWKREAERFAPDLRVLSLHGKDRATRFAEIARHDVVLTTYPLLWRDFAALVQTDWRWLILDEAQTVKNAGSRAAKAVRELRARHRLCLTGTPLENHLGELWAQFDFLLPGFLGDSKHFNRAFRTPIEKHGNILRAELLARRVAPFILRRRKQDVAQELPPKTIIVRSAELVGGQRDLYETVRSTMDARVRDAIAQQGFARSQIVILDALLKLRQVCCDPRLLKSPAAQKVKERAKLDLLMDILPELVDEGRRVLVFSQFTSMLALIETELQARSLPYCLLTGDTREREAVVTQFQDGAVPVFLISLKAGGVGLNLTAADTIIHFDPWWNPAVENQATDRAHRIGQTQHVFVYKLVVAGSIEEKILALQEKKAELAASVLSEDSAALTKFGEADIAALLEPLPAVPLPSRLTGGA